MMQTWYVMTDESYGDPAEILTGENGKLVHKDGRKVAYAPHGPRSRSIDVDAEGVKAAPKREAVSPVNREMKAKAGKRYETR